MALYRQIQTTFWEDEKVVDEFTPEDRYFMLYLMTNPHTNLTGCYSITIRQMEFETGYNKDTILKLICRFENILKVINYDENTKEILIINWHKYNWTNSPKMMNGIKKDIEKIKSEKLKNKINRVCIGYGYGMDRVSVAIAIEQEKEIEKEKELELEKEKKPNKKQIEDYCKIQGITNVNIDDFCSYYKAADWWDDLRNRPINWKQKLVTWKMKEKSNNTSQTSNTEAEQERIKQEILIARRKDNPDVKDIDIVFDDKLNVLAVYEVR